MKFSVLTTVLLSAAAVSLVSGAFARELARSTASDEDGDAQAATALLAERCFKCHGPRKQKSELRLDLRERAIQTIEGAGAAIVPGDSAASEVIRRVQLRDDDIMPPKGEPLSPDQVELLKRWIDSGALYPERAGSDAQNATAELDAVRGILSENCYSCHGEVRQRAGLRLDQEASALALLESGRAAVVPGSSATSELIRRVRLTDDDAMPANSERLSEADIETLAAWIDRGAEWPDGMEARHWSYVAPIRPALPQVADASWVRNEIDRFVLARLEALGVAPSPEADRATLLRRLSLDLIGLPPTTEELASFLADSSEDAYERAVERLLASPHFGERWARHWLDLARYSDSNGYSRDFKRSIWPFRDWVVDALNADMPFDQFTLEQLAGDLIPNATRAQLIATGFHRNTLVQNEGGADDEEFRVEAVKNRVDTTSTVWLGSTMFCAQCHDHKYDPFEHRDYYQMFAFFNQTSDRGRSTVPRMELPTPEQAAITAQIDPMVAALDKQLITMTPELQIAQDKWVSEYNGDGDWHTLRPERVSSTDGVEFEALDDGSYLAVGSTPIEAVYSILANPKERRITGIRLQVLTDPSLPLAGPGREGAGNFALTEFVVSTVSEGELEPAPPLAIRNVTASFAHKRGPILATIDNDSGTGWAVTPRTGYGHEAVFTLAEPLVLPEGTRLSIDLEQLFGDKLTIGRFHLALTSVEDPPPAAVIPRELLEEILETPKDERTAEQKQQLDWFFFTITPELDEVRAERERLLAERPKPDTTLVMETLAKPRKTHLLKRGSFLTPGEELKPGVPDFLLPLASSRESATRTELAEWLVHRDNPLTARVQVNRWWQRFFGLGIVKSENDFGTRGQAASHPELLDWLAVELMESGWSFKATLRRMVLSATYRQSSTRRDDLEGRDPENRWLARQSRIRLEGEVVRDSALLASGRLSRKFGGPPVFPPMPAFDSVLAAKKEWPESTGEDRFRRTLYTFHWRNSPYPFVSTFDGAGSNDACTRRANSNTPLQALVMANDPMIFELAQALANRVLAASPSSDAAALELAFELCLSRQPTSEELDILQVFLNDQRVSFRAAPESAAAAADSPEGIDATEAAAWTALARVLFNLDEFLTRG